MSIKFEITRIADNMVRFNILLFYQLVNQLYEFIWCWPIHK
jgi:hypothetical protein